MCKLFTITCQWLAFTDFILLFYESALSLGLVFYKHIILFPNLEFSLVFGDRPLPKDIDPAMMLVC